MIRIDESPSVAIPRRSDGGSGLTTADSAVVGLVVNNDGTDPDEERPSTGRR